MTELNKLTTEELSDGIKNDEFTISEYITAIYDQIDKVEGTVNSYISIRDKEEILNQNKLIEKDDNQPLKGIIVAVKDNINVKNMKTSCGSKMLNNYVSPFNSTVIKRLLQKGLIIIGKTNMDEFGMGSTTETSFDGVTRNPWDTSRVPGGSSGGSATSLISDTSTLALGSDTGGSIRCPAAFCSVVGLKPSYGLVSRYGLVSYANSLEQIGPMGKNVHDVATLLQIISGKDELDSTTTSISNQDYVSNLNREIKNSQIGLIKEMIEPSDPKVQKSVWKAIDKLKEIGVKVEEISIPILKYALPSYYVLAMSEASSNLARYDGIRYGFNVDSDIDYDKTISKTRYLGFGDEVKKRIMIGSYSLSAGYYEKYYIKALKIRNMIKKEFIKIFKKKDALISPTMPMLPPKIGNKIIDPEILYSIDINTVPANLSGIPALSIPCGYSDRLPIGLQIMGPMFREDIILNIGYAYEQTTNYCLRRPKNDAE